jgi:hypothetical protein
VATLITALTGPAAYLELVRTVVKNGVKRSPRNQATRDLGMTVVEIERPRRATPLGVGRGLNRHIMAAEAVQLVGAFSDANLMPATFEPYKEADGRFWGAYGDRIGFQLMDVVRKIRQDHATRQAVIALWNPHQDNEPIKNDYPCTLNLTFSTDEDGYLDLDVIMRSQDVWLGTPYDWCQFSVLQQTVATLTDRECGLYRHTTLSTHIYERDVAKALEKLHDEPEEVEGDSFPAGLARPGDTPMETIQRVRQIPYVDRAYMVHEHWFRDAILKGRGNLHA